MIDTENKSRSVLGLGLAFLVVLPVADASIDTADSPHALGLYAESDYPAPVTPEPPPFIGDLREARPQISGNLLPAKPTIAGNLRASRPTISGGLLAATPGQDI